MARPSTTALYYVDYDGKLLSLEFDAFLSEQHQHAAKATQFPVETGAVISDHVIQEPDQIRLEAFVSDTPLPSNVADKVISPEEFDLLSADPNRSSESSQVRGRSRGVYLALLELMEARKPVSVATSVRTYENMVIESIDLPVDASRGDAAQVSIALRHVRQVGLKTVPVPKIAKANPKVAKGKVATIEAPAKTASVVADLLDRLKGGSKWRKP